MGKASKRHDKVIQWKRATKLVARESYEVLSEFRTHTQPKKNERSSKPCKIRQNKPF